MAQSRYITRPLAEVLKGSHRKVLVLEGARAVGKTLLVQKELSQYNYQTLADQSTYSYAKKHLSEWLESLSLPVVIDEAQRIDDLPLEVKRIVDDLDADHPHFVLTGSASITRTSLDGQDPLTRRSQRFTLNPMTRREFNGLSSISIVDALFDYVPNEKYRSQTSRQEIVQFMQTGGFPTYLLSSTLMSQAERRLSIRTDLDNVLGDTILPESRFDRSIAQSILQELLSIPGGVFAPQRIATLVNKDPRTVERYVSMFVRRFLLFPLPNLRLTADRQVLTKAKLHPIDTSFAAEALLKAGKDIYKTPSILGELFESFVVNQIVPETQWASQDTGSFYWRGAGSHPKEVDLALLRDNELVGIEVKLNTHLDREDFAGLAALRDADPRFKKGFVIYTGTEIEQVSDNFWALPISALWDSNGFDIPEKAVPSFIDIKYPVSREVAPTMSADGAPTDANLFLSYRHQDNDHLGGAITRLMKEIKDEYTFQFGGTLSLFIDTESIHWGDDWRTTISKNINTANIIIPAITPLYLQSEACRKELLEFAATAGNASGNTILPLLWQNISDVRGISHDDPVWQIATSTQYLSAQEIRYLNPDSMEYKQRVAGIVEKLHSVIDNQNEVIGKAAESFAPNNTTGQSFLETMAKIEVEAKPLNSKASDLINALQNLAMHINTKPLPPSASAGQMLVWSRELAQSTQTDVDQVDKNISDIKGIWEKYYNAMDEYIKIIEMMPAGSERNSQILSGSTALTSIAQAYTLPGNTEQERSTMKMLGTIARPLQPLANAYENTINFFISIKTMSTSLLERLNNLSR